MLKILIVDDSIIICKRISEIVQNLGHKVVGFARNGQEAIDLYLKFNPDLVTMDITMPDMDGITALKFIININKEAKILMITSYGQENMVVKSIQVGAIGYILKPISSEKLEKIIGEVYVEYAVDDNVEKFDFHQNIY